MASKAMIAAVQPGGIARAAFGFSGEPVVWLGLDLYIEQAYLDAEQPFGETANLFFGASQASGFYLTWTGSLWEWNDDNGHTGGEAVGDTWMHIDVLLGAGDLELWIDNVKVIDTPNLGVNETEITTGTGASSSSGTVYYDNVTVGTSSRGSSELFSTDFEDESIVPPYSYTTETPGTTLTVGDGPEAPPPPPVTPPCSSFGRFYESPPWRFVVGTLAGITTTWLDKLATDLTLEHVHLGPSTIAGRVPSDNPEINITEVTDDDPFLEEGDRLCWAFERACGVSRGNPDADETPWVVRMAGACLSMEDDGGGDAPTSRFIFYDPWEFLRRRPVLLDDGSLPGQEGRVYPSGTRYDEIIIDQLELMAAFGPVGGGVAAFAFCDWGQTGTGIYGGTIEPTAALTENLTIQQGKSIGDLLDDLVATGEVEPVFQAIYDPMDRPGYTHELSIYVRAGEFKPAAVMAWDAWGRSLAGVNRLRDGRERRTRLRYNAGQGGLLFEEEQDTVALAKFGDYFAQQFFPGIAAAETEQLEPMILRTLALQAEGLTTYRLAPSAARAPIPFDEYDRGDEIPVYASARLRRPIEGERLRVQAIPIAIGEDQLPRIAGLLVSNEYEVAT